MFCLDVSISDDEIPTEPHKVVELSSICKEMERFANVFWPNKYCGVCKYSEQMSTIRYKTMNVRHGTDVYEYWDIGIDCTVAAWIEPHSSRECSRFFKSITDLSVHLSLIVRHSAPISHEPSLSPPDKPQQIALFAKHSEGEMYLLWPNCWWFKHEQPLESTAVS
jgi:hypothetical protein